MSRNINSTFLQPFITYTTKTHTTFGINTESTYDWENPQWTVPINLFVSQVLKIGKQPVSIQLGGRYYAEAPNGGPDWGLRAEFYIALSATQAEAGTGSRDIRQIESTRTTMKTTNSQP